MLYIYSSDIKELFSFVKLGREGSHHRLTWYKRAVLIGREIMCRCLWLFEDVK